MSEQLNQIPHDVQRILKDWNFYRKIWWRIHYAIGICGVVTSITVANNPQVLQQPSWLLNIMSWFAALCIALLTFLDAKKRARVYTAAWRLLYLTIAEYKNSLSVSSKDILFKAIADGEALIANLDA